jgi:hypothetical protein
MYHDLPRTARFWSFLLAVDQDLAEETRKKPALVAATCTRPTIPGSGGVRPFNYPRSNASDRASAAIAMVAGSESRRRRCACSGRRSTWVLSSF